MHLGWFKKIKFQKPLKLFTYFVIYHEMIKYQTNAIDMITFSTASKRLKISIRSDFLNFSKISKNAVLTV